MNLALKQEINKEDSDIYKIVGIYKCLNCGEEIIITSELPSGLVARSVCENLTLDKINFVIEHGKAIYCSIDTDKVLYPTGLELSIIHTCSSSPSGIALLTNIRQKGYDI